MWKLSVVLLIALVTMPAFCQVPADKYAAGTVTEVVKHPGETSATAGGVKYDVSVKVGNTIYVVLYTPPNGTSIVEYRVGADLPVLIGDKTLTFNDLTGDKHELPILSSRPATTQP